MAVEHDYERLIGSLEYRLERLLALEERLDYTESEVERHRRVLAGVGATLHTLGEALEEGNPDGLDNAAIPHARWRAAVRMPCLLGAGALAIGLVIVEASGDIKFNAAGAALLALGGFAIRQGRL